MAARTAETRWLDWTGLALVVVAGHGLVLGSLDPAPAHPPHAAPSERVTLVGVRPASPALQPLTQSPVADSARPVNRVQADPAPPSAPDAITSSAELPASVPDPAAAPPAAAQHPPIGQDTPRSEAEPEYVPAALLEQSPLPVSAPDERMLSGTASTGEPLTLRLLIDAQGQVRAVLPQSMHPDDQRFFERLQAMFLATSFLPGRRDGQNVPTRMDLVIQPTIPELQDLGGLSEISAVPPAPLAPASNP